MQYGKQRQGDEKLRLSRFMAKNEHSEQSSYAAAEYGSTQ